jgi:hypothetical protein
MQEVKQGSLKKLQLSNLRKMLIAASSLVLLAACAKTQNNSPLSDFSDISSDGIIGGASVSDTDPISKTVVAIYDTQNQSLCTGSILSQQLVITAGHCANKANPKAMVLIFGTQLPTKNSPRPVTRPVTDLRLDPRYEQVMAMLDQNNSLDPDSVKEWGDVSVLKFDGGLPPGYKPAEVLPANYTLTSGMTITLAGYGEVDGNKHLGSDGLRKVDVAMADPNFSPTEVMMDQRNGKGACHGDSGGPAYVTVNGKTLLFGVTSRGVRDAANNCSQFSVYSSIPRLMGYISTAVNQLNSAVVTAPTAPAAPAPTPRKNPVHPRK